MAFEIGNNYGNRNGRPKGSKNKTHHKISISFAKDLVNNLIGTFKSGKHYVYKHIINNEVVYIGKGKNDRAWSYNRTLPEHTNAIKQGLVEVRIIASDLSEDEALDIEWVLIKRNKPIFNLNHVTNTSQIQLEFSKKE